MKTDRKMKNIQFSKSFGRNQVYNISPCTVKYTNSTLYLTNMSHFQQFNAKILKGNRSRITSTIPWVHIIESSKVRKWRPAEHSGQIGSNICANTKTISKVLLARSFYYCPKSNRTRLSSPSNQMITVVASRGDIFFRFSTSILFTR